MAYTLTATDYVSISELNFDTHARFLTQRRKKIETKPIQIIPIVGRTANTENVRVLLPVCKVLFDIDPSKDIDQPKVSTLFMPVNQDNASTGMVEMQAFEQRGMEWLCSKCPDIAACLRDQSGLCSMVRENTSSDAISGNCYGVKFNLSQSNTKLIQTKVHAKDGNVYSCIPNIPAGSLVIAVLDIFSFWWTTNRSCGFCMRVSEIYFERYGPEIKIANFVSTGNKRRRIIDGIPPLELLVDETTTMPTLNDDDDNQSCVHDFGEC